METPARGSVAGATGVSSAQRSPRPTSRDSPPRLPSGGAPIAGEDEREAEELGARRLEGIDGTGSDLSRLLSLSDGVFAFALTFLAITILLPQAGGAALPSLTAYLARLEPAFVGYLLSFFVIATWWSAHHRLFSSIVRYDQRLVRYNTFFLLVISVTPFLVSLLFAYVPNGFGRGSPSARLAVALYGLVQALGGTMLLVIWRHASYRRRLVRPSLPDEWIRQTEQNQLLTVVVFLASVGIAFLSPLVAELTWIIMIFGPGRRFLRRSPPPLPPAAPSPRP